MKSALTLTVVGGLMLACGSHSALAQTVPPPPTAAEAPRISLRYDVTFLPESKSLYVEGRLNAPAEKATGWIAGAEGVGTTSDLPAEGGRYRFGYVVTIAQRERSNAPQSEMDLARFRSWGSGIFLIPSLAEGEVGPIETCFTLPDKWTLITPAGSGRCITVAGEGELLWQPILAGNFQQHGFTVGPTEVTLALRDGHPVSPAEFAAKLRLLIKGATDYLAVSAPPRVFFGVDRLGEGRTTYAPANNISNSALSSTVLIDSDALVGGRKYWGTYAHEFVHSWIPSAFGNSAATREQLGSIFIEGFSDYLAYRIAFASGLIDRSSFAAALSEFYLEYREAALKAPGGNPEFLRYRQGMMAAWMLDLELLKASRGQSGFRELMHLLMQRHLKTDGISREEMKDALRTLGGAQVASLYDPLTDISRPIDFSRHLGGTGIEVLPVGDFAAAIERGDAAVRLDPRGRAQRRFLARWIAG